MPEASRKLSPSATQDASAPRAALFDGLADAMEHALVLIGKDGIITFVNPQSERMFGYSRVEMVGSSLDMIIPKRLRGAHTAGVARIAKGMPSRLMGRSVEVAALRRDGTEFAVELSLSMWPGPNGTIMAGMMRDISERKRRDERLHRLAHHDPLTGLANRVQFDLALDGALESRTPATVLLVGLDGIGKVNDNLGHQAGDSLLQAVTVRLRSFGDDDMLIARLGGDEFAFLLQGADAAMDAAHLADRLIEALRAPFRMADSILKLDAAIGIAHAPLHATERDELVAAADLALQAARRAGKSAWHGFDEQLREEAGGRRALKDALRDALALDEFVLVFQPKVELSTGAIVGAEALLRWRHPVRGMLSPGDFIDTLETHAIALSVGTRVLEMGCAQAARWREAGHPAFHIAVNLFAAQIEAGNLVETVRETLARHRLPPQALELEVTETVALKEIDDLISQFQELRALGVGIALDDFGTGHASLNTLSRLPITTLKIDRGFVAGLDLSSADTAIVKAVIGIGSDLGLDVVAEGVETDHQVEALKAMGCRRGQGYRFSRPVECEAFEALLSSAAGR